MYVDISFGNLASVDKTELILNYSKNYETFTKMALIVKIWAKRRNVSNSASKGLNNFVFILLVLNYFQRNSEKKIVFPIKNFVENQEDKTELNQNFNLRNVRFVPKHPKYDYENKIVSENKKNFTEKKIFSEEKNSLFFNLLHFFKELVEFDYENLCVSCRCGGYIPKSSSPSSQTTTPLNFLVEVI